MIVVRRCRLGAGLIALAAVLVAVNGLALFGARTALWIDDSFQLSAAFAAVVCGLLAARRVTAAQRWWRLLIAAGMFCWAAGQVIWSWYQLADNEGLPSPSLADIGYLAFPVCALPALFVLASARRRSAPKPWTAHFGVAVVLDGVAATVCLFILAWSTGLGAALRAASSPGVVAWAVAVAYPATDLILVVVALLLVLFRRIDPAYSANFLLLAAGIVALACSDSIFACLITTDAQSMKPWEDAGYVLGPLLIACALVARPSKVSVTKDAAETPELWQLVLPYAPVVAVGVVIAGELIAGRTPDITVGCLITLVIVVIIIRQVLWSMDTIVLMRRLYTAQGQLTHQVHHDPLTGLFNRRAFADRLDAAVLDGRSLLVVFVDLDDFKIVNDEYGHATGDKLLVAVSQRLLQSVRSTDTVARMGGDEFAVLVEGETLEPHSVAARIRSALRQPFAVHGSGVVIRASLGLVVPDPEEPLLTAEVLLRRADASMYASKKSGKDSVVMLGSEFWHSDFPTALRRARGGVPDGFRLVYQPIVALPEGTTIAVEALARWTTPEGVEIEPETFVSAAERAGLGGVLDTLVLDLAYEQITRAKLEVPVHVNIGAERLGQARFEHFVADTVRRHGIAAGQLVVEVTETVPIADLVGGADAIRRLQQLGVRVALDDFGAGYNSLTYLQKLPVDVIKIDRTLTSGSESERAAALCRSIIELCVSMGVDVIAEGVETTDQADRLYAAGCVMAQGYLFGRPAPPLRIYPTPTQPRRSTPA